MGRKRSRGWHGDWPPGRATYYILKTTERKGKIKRRKARLIIGGQYGVPSNVKRGPISVHSGENRCVNTELPRHPVNPESGPLLPPFPPPWKSPLILPLEGPRGGGGGKRWTAIGRVIWSRPFFFFFFGRDPGPRRVASRRHKDSTGGPRCLIRHCSLQKRDVSIACYAPVFQPVMPQYELD